MLTLDQQPEIIEFYGATVDFAKSGKYKIVDELELLIKPSRPINETSTVRRKNISLITGITNVMLVDAPSFAQVVDKIRGTLEHAPLLIAHNLEFDKQMIEIELQRLSRIISWPRGICTIEATSYLKGDRLKLEELHQYLFGQKFQGAHRAKQDVTALIRCCGELYKRGII
jgi:DNA polymerase III alpha subunit (gram-positive type)